MKKAVSLSPKEYIAWIKYRLDSPLMLGQERFTGWCLGSVFSVNYYSGKEFGRRNYPISNKAMGLVVEKNGKSYVSYFIFPGLTDPVSLVILFLMTLFIFLIIEAPYPALFALGWTVAVALTTALCTAFSVSGQNGAASLNKFLTTRKT